VLLEFFRLLAHDLTAFHEREKHEETAFSQVVVARFARMDSEGFS